MADACWYEWFINEMTACFLSLVFPSDEQQSTVYKTGICCDHGWIRTKWKTHRIAWMARSESKSKSEFDLQFNKHFI